MSVSFENKETNRGVLTFTISQDQIKPELDRVFNSVKKTLNVPGFRKGHLPRPIFDKKFGEETLYQDVLNALLPNAYEAAVKEAGLEVVAQPKIDVTFMGITYLSSRLLIKNSCIYFLLELEVRNLLSLSFILDSQFSIFRRIFFNSLDAFVSILLALMQKFISSSIEVKSVILSE